MSPRSRMLLTAIAVLAMLGVAISSVALRNHYGTDKSAYCDLGEAFNCDIVNRSGYSQIEGIPVAGIGVLGYGALFFLSTFARSRPETPNRLLGAALAGFAFALYLTYIEAYELNTWCILCLGSQAIIFLIVVLAAIIKARSIRA